MSAKTRPITAADALVLVADLTDLMPRASVSIGTARDGIRYWVRVCIPEEGVRKTFRNGDLVQAIAAAAHYAMSLPCFNAPRTDAEVDAHFSALVARTSGVEHG